MIYIVLPAFNEAKSINVLCLAISKVMDKDKIQYKVVVVNDGSTDHTLDATMRLKKKLPLEVINHRKNKGLAAAVETGFKYVLKTSKHDDVVVTMDADNTHPPKLISKMREKINGGYDVVIASRFVPGSKVVGLSLCRRILSLGDSILFRLLFPIEGVKDYSCGFRAYNFRALKMAYNYYDASFISQEGFSFMPDILLKLRRFNLRMCEVPFTLRYDLKRSTSKMKVAKTIRETLALLLKRKVEVIR